MPYYKSQNKGTNPMDKFKQLSPRLIYIAATVAAVVVGVSKFLYRAWYSNDVGTKLKSITYRMFSVLKTISTTITDELETPSASDKLKQKLTKGYACTQKELDRLWKESDDADAEVAPKSTRRKRTRKQHAEPQVG